MESDGWRKKLHNLRETLIELDKQSAESRDTVELDQTRVGRLSRMDAIQGQAMSKAVAERRRQTLLRIEAALLRLDEDEYGYCIACGDEILIKRLKLDPAIATCTGCAS